MNEPLSGLTSFDFSDYKNSTYVAPKLEPESMCPVGTISTNPTKTGSDLNRITCETCNVSLYSQNNYDQHMLGQKHLKKMNQLNKISSGILNIKGEPIDTTIKSSENKDCNPEQRFDSEQHIQKETDFTEDNFDTENLSNKPVGQFRCDLCNVVAVSNEQLKSHLEGKRHQRTLTTKIFAGKNICEKSKNLVEEVSTKNKIVNEHEKPKTVEKLRCEICDLTFTNNIILDGHLAGKKHLKKLNNMNSVDENKDEFKDLNIAWDKYKVTNQEELKTHNSNGQKYEFFCALCNAYCPKKPQLVEHLRSKKHHRKIHEKRTGLTSENNSSLGNNMNFKIEQSNAQHPNYFQGLGQQINSHFSNNSNNNKKFGSNFNNTKNNGGYNTYSNGSRNGPKNANSQNQFHQQIQNPNPQKSFISASTDFNSNIRTKRKHSNAFGFDNMAHGNTQSKFRRKSVNKNNFNNNHSNYNTQQPSNGRFDNFNMNNQSNNMNQKWSSNQNNNFNNFDQSYSNGQNNNNRNLMNQAFIYDPNQ